MIIDGHVHLEKGDTQGDKLIKLCDTMGVDKVVLFGGAEYWGFANDDDVMAAYKAHPDRIIPLGWFRPGVDEYEVIDRKVEQGFQGFKTSVPRKNYDDPEYFPFYEKIAGHGVPILFHLGIVLRFEKDREEDINNGRMKPIYLDTIARSFPAIKIIGAHFGNPWYEEAGMVARWNGNIWFDLSGSTLKKKTPEDIRKLLWWDAPGNYYMGHEGKMPFDKILYGTDVAYSRMQDVKQDYERFCDAWELDDKWRKKIFGLNAAEIFGLIKPEEQTGEVINPFSA